ncbi:Gfo/Idh/MocA family protein [Butyrivibrio proteoclasticus]|uniref:Gfo/Idh/MocA family protein n=1 Tax=Butyrivibrio proteoclasticus TaxID=43305 RepID=UPI00047B85E6|nr:Gfo/Idh/MocA family oxidoreductase [Butyrivibrio proteoclasticus]
MKLTLIGAGQRGRIYADYAFDHNRAEIAYVVEPDIDRRQAAADKYGLSEDKLFTDPEDFYKLGKVTDAVIIATMDRQHYGHVMKALELGYDILLEKPISPNLDECLKIRDLALKNKCKVMVCHVLRYTGFWGAIKKIVDSGELGKVIDIQHNENIGNFHIAHSFVRGNWRNSAETSSLIMQKSCHDMDLLTWITGSRARSVSSFGELSFFNKDHAPEGSADRCLDCKVTDCRFDARKVYLPIAGEWPATVLSVDQSEEGLMKAIKEGPYGRCVYHCDNNVCDHQVAIFEFENGVHASFNLSGFTNRMCRTIKIMCENGEIRGDDGLNEIEIIRFAPNWQSAPYIKKFSPDLREGFHGGGDSGLMENFLGMLEGTDAENLSAIERSIESHVMAIGAEKSRVEHRTIELEELRTTNT